MPDAAAAQAAGSLFSTLLTAIPAAGGLGTAAMGLVDACKYFDGGPSNIGFSDIRDGLADFLPPEAEGDAEAQLHEFGKAMVLDILHANWINGVAAADQKAMAKKLILHGLPRCDAPKLAAAAGVDGDKLGSLLKKKAVGTAPAPDETDVFGEFDGILSAVLDEAYERADQKYRNACKLLSATVSTVLAVLAGWFLNGHLLGYFVSADFPLAVMVGLSGAPLSPVAKDLVSSLQAASAAIGTVKPKQ
jgi:hypothetical protein